MRVPGQAERRLLYPSARWVGISLPVRACFENDLVEFESGEGMLAVFEGFDGAVEIAIDDVAVLAPEEAVLAPGVVAVSYTDEDGRSGVLGLR